MDQRHSLVVLQRLNAILPNAGRDAQAAALLHDIGKTKSQLGVFSRVVATLVGPRTTRFLQYHQHENIGLALLQEFECSPETVGLLRGMGDPTVLAALSAADNI